MLFRNWLARFALPVVLSMRMVGQNLLTHDIPADAAYFWETTPVAGGAEILTLFVAQPSNGVRPQTAGVPIIAVLRDSLGDPNHGTDRLRYVWLLASSAPTFTQEVLSAIPAFHWHVGTPKPQPKQLPKPLLDLGHPANLVQRHVWREAIERSASGLLAFGLRDLPKPYLSNHADRTRLHVEEAISVLRRAPVSEEKLPLSKHELETIIVRLSLSKRALGGLQPHAELLNIERSENVNRQTSRLRNWELLRSLAERAGLYVEPLTLAEESAAAGPHYGLLWFPLHVSFSTPGTSLDKTWQLLQISNPFNNSQQSGSGPYRQARSLDQDGRLLPAGQKGASTIDLIPLAMYSLTYPRMPLLLMDFLHPNRVRHREWNQRLLNEIGVVGFSALSIPALGFNSSLKLYYSYKDRQGFAVNEKARLDCYSEARIAMALDRSLDADFRRHAQNLLTKMSINPLDTAIDQEIAAASTSYTILMEKVAEGEKFRRQLDEDRRQELAAFGAGKTTMIRGFLLHYVTFGIYTRREPANPNTIESTRGMRRVEDLIEFLTQVTADGNSPEIAFDANRVEITVQELSALTRTSPTSRFRQQFLKLAQRLLDLSQDEGIREQCKVVLELSGDAPGRAATKRALLGHAGMGYAAEQ